VPLPTYPFERQRFWIDAVRLERHPTPLAEAAEAAPVEIAQPAEAEAPPVLSRLRALLHEMSGVPVERMDASASLLELGFDSLFLTQVALALQKSFGVKIAFRQLFEELATLEALAAHLAVSQPATAPYRNGAKPAALAIKAPVAKPTPAQAQFGPFRPVQSGGADHFTPAQKQHLEPLIARYSARTAASKRLAQEHRPHFADPRAVSGFRKAWKEIVYPLAAKRSAGARLWDIDGNEYIDFTMGFGTNLLGHSPQFITDAVKAQLDRGVEIGPAIDARWRSGRGCSALLRHAARDLLQHRVRGGGRRGARLPHGALASAHRDLQSATTESMTSSSCAANGSAMSGARCRSRRHSGARRA
jgi:acyl carrier protein